MIRYEVAPSILSADFARLGEEIKAVEPHAGRIHIDVMDGHFVPNLSMGPMVVRSIRRVTRLPLEVHLMVEDPEAFIDPFVEAGADRLAFHLEVVDEPSRLVEKIKGDGVSAGLALNPSTPWEAATPYLESIDLLILMTVNPGFGAQAFLEEVLPKVTLARELVSKLGAAVDIEVDGGVDPRTAPLAKEAGANIFVAGNAIFGTRDPSASAMLLAEIVR